MKALVGAFNQEKALVGAFSVIVQPVVEPMDRFAALVSTFQTEERLTRRPPGRGKRSLGSWHTTYMLGFECSGPNVDILMNGENYLINARIAV